MTELCKCGNCAQAYERAFSIAEKMLMDEECPIFVMGVADAMVTIGASAVNKLVVGRTTAKSGDESIDRLMAVLFGGEETERTLHTIARQIDKHGQANAKAFSNRVQVAMEKAEAKFMETRKMAGDLKDEPKKE